MNKIIISFICILSLVLSGCMKTSENVHYYNDVPALVGYDRIIGQPVLITYAEVFVAPEVGIELQYATLSEGEAILAYFSLDENQDPIEGYRTITDFNCVKLGISSVMEAHEVIANDYTPIDEIEAFGLIVHEKKMVMYVAFSQNTRYRSYEYEMTFDADEKTAIPTLSIRSKVKGQEYEESVGYLTPYVFDMYDYVMSQPKNSDNQVLVNLRYQTGVDGSGNEIWAYYASNPLSIPVP